MLYPRTMDVHSSILSEWIFRHGYYHGHCMDTSTRENDHFGDLDATAVKKQQNRKSFLNHFAFTSIRSPKALGYGF